MIYYNFILSKNVKKNLYFFFKEKYVCYIYINKKNILFYLYI